MINVDDKIMLPLIPREQSNYLILAEKCAGDDKIIDKEKESYRVISPLRAGFEHHFY